MSSSSSRSSNDYSHEQSLNYGEVRGQLVFDYNTGLWIDQSNGTMWYYSKEVQSLLFAGMAMPVYPQAQYVSFEDRPIAEEYESSSDEEYSSDDEDTAVKRHLSDDEEYSSEEEPKVEKTESWANDEIEDLDTDIVTFFSRPGNIKERCARIMSSSLGEKVDPAHILTTSDMTSTLIIFYKGKPYIVDICRNVCFNGILPQDLSVIGRPILSQGEIHGGVENKTFIMDQRSAIKMSYIVNARDDSYSVIDFYPKKSPRLIMLHYKKTKGVPQSKSLDIRGTIVNLEGFVVCTSYGHTPVCVYDRIEADSKGKISLQTFEDGTKFKYVFNADFKEFDITGFMKSVDKGNKIPAPGIIAQPFFQGVLLRVFLDWSGDDDDLPVMHVSSHSKISTEKSKWRDSETFLDMFNKFGLTREILFGDYRRATFQYNFMLMDDSFLHTSRITLPPNGALVFLGVMYNTSSDPFFSPYAREPTMDEIDEDGSPTKKGLNSITEELSEILMSVPVDVEDFNNDKAVVVNSFDVPEDGRNIIVIPPTFTSLAQINAHLQREFNSTLPNSEGSVIIMEKDPSGVITKVVRVMSQRESKRHELLQGDSIMEGFVKLMFDADPVKVPYFNFMNKYTIYDFDSTEDLTMKKFVGVLMKKFPNGLYAKHVTSYIEGVRNASKSNKLPLARVQMEEKDRIDQIFLNYLLALPVHQQKNAMGILMVYNKFRREVDGFFKENWDFLTDDANARRFSLVRGIYGIRSKSAPSKNRNGVTVIFAPKEGFKSREKKPEKIDSILTAADKPDSHVQIWKTYNKIKKMIKDEERRAESGIAEVPVVEKPKSVKKPVPPPKKTPKKKTEAKTMKFTKSSSSRK